MCALAHTQSMGVLSDCAVCMGMILGHYFLSGGAIPVSTTGRGGPSVPLELLAL